MLKIIRPKKTSQLAAVIGYPSKINGDNMKPAGISGIKREYLKHKIDELAVNSKNKNY
jgi:hypothetical protein